MINLDKFLFIRRKLIHLRIKRNMIKGVSSLKRTTNLMVQLQEKKQ